jgi:hypothetical protein
MAGKHGSTSRGTEVPREKLVTALKSQSELYNTQQLKGEKFYEDITMEIL